MLFSLILHLHSFGHGFCVTPYCSTIAHALAATLSASMTDTINALGSSVSEPREMST